MVVPALSRLQFALVFVRMALSLGAEGLDDFQNPGGVGTLQAVIDVAAVSSAFDQAAECQDLELLGDG